MFRWFICCQAGNARVEREKATDRRFQKCVSLVGEDQHLTEEDIKNAVAELAEKWSSERKISEVLERFRKLLLTTNNHPDARTKKLQLIYDALYVAKFNHESGALTSRRKSCN